jgi:hypothetical protein
MKAIRSSETLCLTRTTRRLFPEDGFRLFPFVTTRYVRENKYVVHVARVGSRTFPSPRLPNWLWGTSGPCLVTTGSSSSGCKAAGKLSSPLTAHRSPLTSHRSPLTAHLSPLTAHLSPLTAHLSPLTSHLSPLTSRRSPLTAHLSPLTSHRSPLTAHRSPLTAHRSPPMRHNPYTPSCTFMDWCLLKHGESYLYPRRINSQTFWKFNHINRSTLFYSHLSSDKGHIIAFKAAKALR